MTKHGITILNQRKKKETKYGRVPVVAKRTISTKKVLKCIYLSCDGKTILIPVPKGKSFKVGIIEI